MANNSSKGLLALDVGKKRIGISYCDQLRISISILPTLIRDKEHKEIALIKKYIEEKRIGKLLIGLPLNDKGEITKQAIDCKNYSEIISKNINIPYEFVNEHSSSWEAQQRFNIKRDKSGDIDGFSSYIILEQWIKENPE
tara:strand:- start:14710 stop:15129 length:420 start_codon:yes stop_codon:yes gene_type:complete